MRGTALALCLICSNAFAQTPLSMHNEILKLKESVSLKKRTEFVKQQAGIADSKELHSLAMAEAKLMKVSITYNTYLFLDSMDINRDINEMYEIVDSAFKNAFIFTDLGETHLERWNRINGWAYTETNFKNGITCKWKKGQYLKSLNVTISYDSTDTGVWQINDVNDFCLIPRLYDLYDRGIISFKIKRDRKTPDLFDIPTNCAFRCLVETERRRMGLNWKQDKSKSYLKFISKTIASLVDNGYYDGPIVEKYFNVAPARAYFIPRTPESPK